MIPTDYRLEQVCARLTERLEGARRSYVGEPDRAEEEFRRIAEDHVEAAIGEFTEVSMADDPEHHAEFLRHEVFHTFLPRYRRMALEMTAREQQGFGLGPLAEPIGRVALGGFALLVLFLLARFLYLPYIWPIALLDISLPFWPDIFSAISRRSYRRELVSMLTDLGTIQEQEGAYLRPEQLRTDETHSDPKAASRRPTRETT